MFQRPSAVRREVKPALVMHGRVELPAEQEFPCTMAVDMGDKLP